MTGGGQSDEIFPGLQMLPWLKVQEDHGVNLWTCVWINDYLYFLCLLGSVFQHF